MRLYRYANLGWVGDGREGITVALPYPYPPSGNKATMLLFDKGQESMGDSLQS